MEFYGLIGEKLGHSYSPQIQQRLLELLGVQGGYKLFEIPKDKIGGAAAAIRLLGIKGVNVTIPYKQELLGQVDALSPEAEAIGAVNTLLLREDGTLYGANTDYFGFGRMVASAGITIRDKVCVVLGAGGASKAVLAYLKDAGAKMIYLVSRDPARPVSLPNGVCVTRVGYSQLDALKGDVLINTTPVGMYPNTGISPVAPEVIAQFDALVDLIYNPTETEFLRLGRSMGKTTCDGLYMLVAQAARSQEIWQGRPVEEAVIRQIYGEIKEELTR